MLDFVPVVRYGRFVSPPRESVFVCIQVDFEQLYDGFESTGFPAEYKHDCGFCEARVRIAAMYHLQFKVGLCYRTMRPLHPCPAGGIGVVD